MQWLVPSKEQIEYVRINSEYDFVKKRALVNFLTNSRVALEGHFHGRAQNMLTTVERYEQSNLRNLIGKITQASFAKIEETLADPAGRTAVQD